MSDLPKIIQWWQDKELLKYYDELPVNSPSEMEHILRQNITATDRLDYIIETKKKKTPLAEFI